MPILAFALTAAVMATTQGSSPVGSIVGCVVDTMLQGLPRVTVVAKGGGVRRTTVADSTGCYELNNLPAAPYRVTARLTGFDNVTRDRLMVAPSTATRLDLTMSVSSICECIRGGGSLAALWDHADAVLHVRLSDSEPASSTPQGYYRHSATVVSALKQPAGSLPATIFVLQNQRSGTPEPYDVGQELVAFFESSGANAFRFTNDDDATMVFLVQEGRIQRPPTEFSSYFGMTISSFFEELRTRRQ